jgi:pentatricopeptide repeat protein
MHVPVWVPLKRARVSVHVQIVQSGLESEVFVGSSLVDMYAKCGSCDDALKVFNTMPSQDMVT